MRLFLPVLSRGAKSRLLPSGFGAGRGKADKRRGRGRGKGKKAGGGGVPPQAKCRLSVAATLGHSSGVAVGRMESGGLGVALPWRVCQTFFGSFLKCRVLVAASFLVMQGDHQGSERDHFRS